MKSRRSWLCKYTSCLRYGRYTLSRLLVLLPHHRVGLCLFLIGCSRGQLQRFCFSSQILHFLTSKVNHDDRNGHITCNFFHCQAMISLFTKVIGLQSRKIFEKTEVQSCFGTKNIVVGIKMHSA